MGDVKRLVSALESCGFEPEQRPYRPHVTLARKVRGRPETGSALMEWFCDDFCLVESAGGKYSVLRRWPELRKMGALARHMLVSAAADQLDVPVGELTTARSRVLHAASGRTLSYADLAERAARQSRQSLPESWHRPRLRARPDRRSLGVIRRGVTEWS